MPPRKSCSPWLLFLTALVILGLMTVILVVPTLAETSFGAPDPSLNPWQRFSYAFVLVWHSTDLTQPPDPFGVEQLFVIEPGESVFSMSNRLEAAGLIRSAATFRAFLLWAGLDRVIQSGTYRLSPSLNGREIAGMLITTTLTEVTFNVLPGWRMEEIAAALPTSGLGITPEAFMASAAAPVNPPEYLPGGASAEGFLAPGQYILPRTTTTDQLVSVLLQGFAADLTPEMQNGFASQGLTVYQAVTLASILQREAVLEDELPMIASVFYNRLAAGMKLQSDPTVQYALGYDAARSTWWTSPLSASDLQFDSPYNTYLYPNLPPGPISNPGLAALIAVAFPAKSNYYFFQARCDGSGQHNFAETYETHLQNNCP